MPTALEKYDALRHATAHVPCGAPFVINVFDQLDLCKLTASDLVSRGFDDSVAERVSADLLRGSVEQLGDAIGIDLRVERVARWLIPGEGIRRSAGALADEGQTLDQTLRELDEIRHPEGHAR